MTLPAGRVANASAKLSNSRTCPIQQKLNFSKQDLRLVRVGASDSVVGTDHLANLRAFVLESEPSYPGIDHWFADKVQPGLATQERVAYLAYLGDKPTGAAILKLGSDAKLCHLRVAQTERGRHLGDMFFALTAAELLGTAQSLHFTLPESLWAAARSFFVGFGFKAVNLNETQYRTGDEELRCGAEFVDVWRNVLSKLPGLLAHFNVGGAARDPSLMLSLHPSYADSILNGTKRVEIRRRFNTSWAGHRASLYAVAPSMSVVGDVGIDSVVSGSPDSIWREFSSDIGCSAREFAAYAGERSELFAILLKEPRRLRRPVPLSELGRCTNTKLTPPQSYGVLKPGSEWAQAVSAAALLGG